MSVNQNQICHLSEYWFLVYLWCVQPDITAPGIGILAAWPPKTPPTLLPGDHRSIEWNFQSGTSMSCPHVAGVMALLQSAHPDWSPAAIRSAIMTTGSTSNRLSHFVLTNQNMILIYLVSVCSVYKRHEL